MKPRVTVISVLFNSDRFLPRLFLNITGQTIFDACEWICFLPADASQTAWEIVREYEERYGGRVRSVRVDHDPGLYALWNQGVKIASGEYITNANPDDLRAPSHIASCVAALDQRPGFDVCAGRIGYTNDEQEKWRADVAPAEWIAELAGEFHASDLFTLDADMRTPSSSRNIPHCMPVWCKSLHARFGWFDEEQFGPSADWEFWLRCLSGGARGWLLDQVLGLYLLNPESYWRANLKAREFDARVLAQYGHGPLREFRLAEQVHGPATGLLQRANEMVRRGDVATATALYADYCKANPSFAPGWMNYLMCLARLNRADAFRSALTEMLAALHAQPKHFERLQLISANPWRQIVADVVAQRPAGPASTASP